MHTMFVMLCISNDFDSLEINSLDCIVFGTMIIKSDNEFGRTASARSFFFLVGDGLKSPADGNKYRSLPRVICQQEDAGSCFNHFPSNW